MRRILGATAAAALVACSDPSAPPAFGTSSGSEPTTGGTTADVTGGTASSSTGAPPVPVVVLEGRFDLEVRDVIDIAVVQLGQDVVVTLDASESLGVLPTGPIEGVGRIDAYPEVGATVYTAIFGAAVLGLAMAGIVAATDTVVMRHRPKEHTA